MACAASPRPADNTLEYAQATFGPHLGLRARGAQDVLSQNPSFLKALTKSSCQRKASSLRYSPVIPSWRMPRPDRFSMNIKR